MVTRPWNSLVQHLRTAVLPTRDEATDADLLESFVQHGHSETLAALVQRHGPLVWSVCRRLLRKPQDAEDAFQATFLVLVRKATTIRHRERCAHWLYRVAYQTSLKVRAVAARRSVREQQVSDMPELAVNPPEPGNDLQSLLDRELNCLPEKYGTVLVLCDLEGKTRPEAARQLGWPEGTVAGRLARARAMLAKRLSRRGLVLSATALASALSCTSASARVPPSVISSTIKAAMQVAAGQVAVGVISPTVATLTEGVLKTMLLSKLRSSMRVLLVVAAFLGVSTGFVMRSGQGQLSLRAEEPEGQASLVERSAQGTPTALRPDEEEPKARASFEGHKAQVASVTFSPDGKTLASGSLEGTVKLWDMATGKERAAVKGYPAVAFSPDGKILATGSRDNTVKLWDSTTGKERASLQGHSYYVLDVAFSPDGKLLASGSGDKTVRLWDVATGKEQVALHHAQGVIALAVSPDGKTLASVGLEGMVNLWNVVTGKQLASCQGHTGRVVCVAFSPDGKSVASGSEDTTVKLWNVATGEERTTLYGHAEVVRSVAFSPDGKTLVSSGDDQSVKLWELATGRQRVHLHGQTRSVFGVAFSPDGKTLATARDDQTVKLWDIPATKQTELTRRGNLSRKDLDTLWADLAGPDAATAYQAMGTLVGAADQGVNLLKERLRPVSKPEEQAIRRWIVELDDNQFAVREQAKEKLEELGEQAAPAVRKALADNPSLEVRQRLEQLLNRVDQERIPAGLLRGIRAIEILEYLGTPDTAKLLEMLAEGAASARLTGEAKASLERLKKRGSEQRP
jgi:RNA polymerase sigma factor (sigma-70 family)